jgi:zinc protease
MALFAELRRRNILKVALLYAVTSWLAVWFVDTIRARVDLPGWTDIFLYTLLAIGFPVALWFAWTYEFTPAGLKKAVDVDQTQSIVYKTGQKLNAAVAVFLVLGVLAVFGQRLLPTFEFLVPAAPQGDVPLASTTPGAIRSMTLDNGLEIIVWPQDAGPNIVMYGFVHAGSRNEHAGNTGIAHFLGHLDTAASGGVLDHELSWTGDYTAYRLVFPRSALEAVFNSEAERIDGHVSDPAVISAQRAIVLAERQSDFDNNHFQLLSEQVRAAAFAVHPYRQPPHGWPSDINAWSAADVAAFHEDYFGPNNRTLVLVGNLVPADAFELADEILGPIEAREVPAMRVREPEQLGVRRIALQSSGTETQLQLAFHTGPVTGPEALPLSLLLQVLAGDDASRLHRLLVEEQSLALSVSASLDRGIDPGLMVFSVVLAPDASPADIEALLLQELQRIAVEGVGEDELEVARAAVLDDFEQQSQDIAGKARMLGVVAVLHGNYEAAFRLPVTAAAVTSDDLAAAAAQTFNVDNMTVGVAHAIVEAGPE